MTGNINIPFELPSSSFFSAKPLSWVLVLPLALAGSAPLLFLALHLWLKVELVPRGLTQVLPGQSRPVTAPGQGGLRGVLGEGSSLWTGTLLCVPADLLPVLHTSGWGGPAATPHPTFLIPQFAPAQLQCRLPLSPEQGGAEAAFRLSLPADEVWGSQVPAGELPAGKAPTAAGKGTFPSSAEHQLAASTLWFLSEFSLCQRRGWKAEGSEAGAEGLVAAEVMAIKTSEFSKTLCH